MNIYRISQSVNQDYDTWDSAVVIAENEEQAKYMHPQKWAWDIYDDKTWDGQDEEYSGWCPVEDVRVQLIGTALPGAKQEMVVASFNAG